MVKKKILISLMFVCFVMSLFANVPAHPLREIPLPQSDLCEDLLFPNSIAFAREQIHRNGGLFNNILVLRVQFPNLPFLDREQYPAYHPHNYEYFRKHMEHLRNFYLDASDGNYDLNYRIAPQVYTANHNIEWYTQAGITVQRRVELIDELVRWADTDPMNEINFADYQGVIVFHSAPGQESDISGRNRHRSFLSAMFTQASFRLILAPDTSPEDYKGIPTSDGSFVSRVAFLPSEQFHPYFPFNDPNDSNAYELYRFDILGGLAQMMGRIMGFPTLFGPGRVAGIGNFCIMGTEIGRAHV